MLDKLLVIDTETTGIYSDVNTIIQLSAAYYENKKLVSMYNIHMVPNEKSLINLGALQANGKKLAELKPKTGRVTEEEAVKEFVDWLLTLGLDRNVILGGMNLDFDMRFLDALFKRHNVAGLWDGEVIPYRKYDLFSINFFLKRTNTLDIAADSKTQRGNSLKAIATSLGIDIAKYKLHDSLEDVKLTAECLFKAEELQTQLVEFCKKNK